MAKKPTIKTISSGFASNTQLNFNFAALRTAHDNTLSLDGSTPNSMGADFDMNGNDILNTGNFDVDTMTVDGATIAAAITAAAGDITTIFWEGAYAGGTAYTVNDGVSYGGSSYVCILNSTGNLPTNGTYWEVFAAGGADGSNGADGADGAGSGDMLIATYDPTTVSGDAFAMDSMVEGTTTKILTNTERTKLSGVETAADVTDETNVTDALDGATLTAISKTDTLKFLVQDDADSSVLKTVAGSQFTGGGPSLGDNSIIRTNARNLITAVTMYELNLTATVDTGADTVDQGTDDGYLDGDIVQFTTTTTLPDPLVAGTDYYVRDIAAASMKVALTYNGTAITLVDTGTGTHTIYRTVNGSSVGPIDINATVTVSSGSTWSIL